MDATPVPVPERLSAESLAELDEALHIAARRPGVKVLVLRGVGGRFCRGMDLEAPSAAGNSRASAAFVAFAEQLVRLRLLPVPTIAVVDDVALGGGLGLAAACDIVLADHRARFGLPELLVGMAPATIYPILLERCTSQRLRRLALTGASVGAEEARTLGLVDDVADTAQLELRLRRWVKDLSRGGGPAVAQLKRLSLPTGEQGLRSAALEGAFTSLELLRSETTRQAMQAFANGEMPWRSP